MFRNEDGYPPSTWEEPPEGDCFGDYSGQRVSTRIKHMLEGAPPPTLTMYGRALDVFADMLPPCSCPSHTNAADEDG